MQNQDRQNNQPKQVVIIDEPTAYSEQASINNEKLKSLRTIAIVVYVLQALSFFTGITALIGLIINYVKKNDAANTWVASHFRWQIRTFWFGLLWVIIGLVLLVVYIGFIVLFINSIWIIYRIVRGVLAAIDHKALYN